MRAGPDSGAGVASSRSGRSGRGKRSAISNSISALLWCVAAATSSSTFPDVRYLRSITTAVTCSRPSATASNRTGKRPAARAA